MTAGSAPRGEGASASAAIGRRAEAHDAESPAMLPGSRVDTCQISDWPRPSPPLPQPPITGRCQRACVAVTLILRKFSPFPERPKQHEIVSRLWAGVGKSTTAHGEGI